LALTLGNNVALDNRVRKNLFFPVDAETSHFPPPVAPSGRNAGGQQFLPPDPVPFCPPAEEQKAFFRATAGD